MFVQVIHGRAKDGEALRKQLDRWDQELKAGSIGFLGGTAGQTDDGEFFMAARFESQEAAQSNSDRPEQGEWWEETAQYFDGEPSFHDYTNVELWNDGGSDDAGFVQAMHGKSKDIKRSNELSSQFDQEASAELRPDILGGVNCWTDDGDFTSINYFTSEAEAREGEKKEPPEEFKKVMDEWMSLHPDVKFIDLKDPIYTSP